MRHAVNRQMSTFESGGSESNVGPPRTRLRGFAINHWIRLVVAVFACMLFATALCQTTPKKKPFHEGNKAYIDDARWVHHKIPDMTGYTLVMPDVSSWCETLDSYGYTNGVEYRWTRTSDALAYTMDTAVFRTGEAAKKAAEIRVDSLGLDPDPVTKDNTGQGQAKFNATALDGATLGDKVWSRAVGTTEAQQVFVKGRTVVCVIAKHATQVDTAEVMRLAQEALPRTK